MPTTNKPATCRIDAIIARWQNQSLDQQVLQSTLATMIVNRRSGDSRVGVDTQELHPTSAFLLGARRPAPSIEPRRPFVASVASFGSFGGEAVA